jgi:hypothetical protein
LSSESEGDKTPDYIRWPHDIRGKKAERLMFLSLLLNPIIYAIISVGQLHGYFLGI